jgi:hypothetical protein
MKKATVTFCILALGMTTAFAGTQSQVVAKPTNGRQHAVSNSHPMNANAKIKGKSKLRKTAATDGTANARQNNNWFGGSPNNDGAKKGNNDWFGGSTNNNVGANGKRTNSASSNNGFNNGWFGKPANGSGGEGAKRSKVSKSNETNNNWFAPSNSTNK